MERNYSIDFMKCLAMFFVVCIHTNTFKGVEATGVNGDDIDFVIDTISRFSVPFFFAASGYLLAKKIKVTPNTWTYFFKYVKKLILLLASWFIFYFLYDLIILMMEENSTIGDIIVYFKDVFTLETIFYGVSYTQYQLWFLFGLIWSVIIVFFFIKIKKFNLLLIISLILNLVGLLGQSYSGIYELALNTRDPFFFGLFYTTLGCFFGLKDEYIYDLVKGKSAYVFLPLTALFLMLQVLERTILVYYFETDSGEYFISTIPLTIILFLFIIKYRDIGKNTVLNRIGMNAVGVYVIHTFIRSITNIIIDELHLEAIRETFAWGILFTPYVFIVSYLLYMFIQNMKQNLFYKEIAT